MRIASKEQWSSLATEAERQIDLLAYAQARYLFLVNTSATLQGVDVDYFSLIECMDELGIWPGTEVHINLADGGATGMCFHLLHTFAIRLEAYPESDIQFRQGEIKAGKYSDGLDHWFTNQQRQSYWDFWEALDPRRPDDLALALNWTLLHELNHAAESQSLFLAALDFIRLGPPDMGMAWGFPNIASTLAAIYGFVPGQMTSHQRETASEKYALEVAHKIQIGQRKPLIRLAS